MFPKHRNKHYKRLWDLQLRHFYCSSFYFYIMQKNISQFLQLSYIRERNTTLHLYISLFLPNFSPWTHFQFQSLFLSFGSSRDILGLKGMCFKFHAFICCIKCLMFLTTVWAFPLARSSSEHHYTRLCVDFEKDSKSSWGTFGILKRSPSKVKYLLVVNRGREWEKEKKHLLSNSFGFETCFVPEQTAEGNILTMSVSEGRQLFNLKSGPINASDYSSGKGQCATKRHTRTHSHRSSLGASINMWGLQKSDE